MKGRTLLLLSLAPLALAAGAAALLSTGWLPNPVKKAYLLADLAGLVLTLGVVLSLAAAAVCLPAWRRDRRARQELAAAYAGWDRERWTLLERLDHELKHALNGMNGALAGLNPDALGPDEQRSARLLAAQTRRLNQFLTDMRKFAAIEATPIERREVDVAAVVREAVALANGAPWGGAAQGTRRVVAEVQDQALPLPCVWGDEELLLRAVYNVVENACKFSPPAAAVQVWALRDGPSAVRIQVADKGPGIPADELAQVGEEFFRGKLARGVPGSGLGLAIVRAIVRKHGGRLDIESELGTGTMVTLHLPAGRERPPEACQA